MFSEYLAASTRLQRPSIDPDRLLDLTGSVESDRAKLLAEALVYQLSDPKSEPLLIVIEDLHLVYDADWVIPFFRRFLPLLPNDVHVLIPNFAARLCSGGSSEWITQDKRDDFQSAGQLHSNGFGARDGTDRHDGAIVRFARNRLPFRN